MRWVTLLSAGLLVAACASGEQGPSARGEFTELTADKVAVGMRHYITANGVRQALLESDSAFYYDDGSPIEFRNVELMIYEEDGSVAAILTSDAATLDPHTEAMMARGNVIVIAPEGDQRIETEELHYDPNADRLWSDLPTTLTREGRVTRGDGFTSDGRGMNVRITNPSGQIDAPRTLP